MKFGPKKGHVLFIFESFIKDFGLLLVALSVAYVKKDVSILTENIPILIIVLLGPIMKVSQYLFTTYAIDDEKLTVKSGWLSKKTLEVPIATITTVDFSQNIIHQISGTYRLNVDNASNVAQTNTKIMMTFNGADAKLVKGLLTKEKHGLDGLNLESTGEEKEKEIGNDYLVKSKTLLFMGAIKSKGIFLVEIIGLVGAGGTFVGNVLDINSGEVNLAIFDFLGNIGVTGTVFIGLPVFFLLAIICGSVGTLIKYYGFHVLDNGETLRIEYGLFTKKRYTIHKKKISGFCYQQSFLMKLCKTGVLQIFAIGYGGAADAETTEDPILVPLLEESLLRDICSDILPEMKEVTEYEKPEKKTFPYFFYSGGFIIALVVLAVTIGLAATIPILKEIWILGLFFLVVSIVSVILQYRNTGIYGNDQNISLSFGGFKKTTIFVKTNNVESVSRQAGYFKNKKGVTSITIGYIAPLTEASKKVKNLSVSAYDHIQSKLIY